MRRFLKLLLAGVVAAAAVTATQPASAQEDQLATLTKGMTAKSGLFQVWHSDQKMLARISTSQVGKNFIVIPSIARGISSGMVLGGMSWNFGDDAIWTFKKVGDKLHVIRKNTRYKAKSGSPEASALKVAYSDSVLYALPIVSESGGYVVDVTRIFMSDDQQVGRAIGSGFRFSSDRSTFAKVANFPKNLEIQVAAIYTGGSSLETIPDSRGVQVNIHYSISELPSNGYKPRLADDRVGYFLTAVKDFSDKEDDQNFVRYINRWHLEKADPKAKLSPPKEPIIFYIEKTVPIHLRPYVQAGIEEWNKAFEKIGFANAIQVRQQTSTDTWDPEDIRYNTFRWITADAGFAMGPSRVNPLTGQILDADIIFDASFLRYWKQDYETMTEAHLRSIMGLTDPDDDGSIAGITSGYRTPAHRHSAECQHCRGKSHQLSFAAAALTVGAEAKNGGELPDEFVYQALKEVVMHEVGHTLGLRHNFKASTWKTLEDISKPNLDPDVPTVASVMDYAPANIVRPGEKQGLFFTQTVGPYDEWAIEYGYKPFESSKEKAGLKEIASRGAEAGLDYATDEDTRSLDCDPLSNRFDLGKDPLAFVERQMVHTTELLPKVVEKAVDEGESYSRGRQAFGALFSEYWRSVQFAARFPGGVYVHRDHKGDKDARVPFEVVEPELQRRAMDLILGSAFASPDISPDTLNRLAAMRWNHWGVSSYSRIDYPIHDVVAQMQGMVLSRLFSTTRLERLLDNERKVSADEDAYTLAEHLTRIVDGIFSELTAKPDGKEGNPAVHTNRKPYIDSYRRALQKETLVRLANLVLSSSAPSDARTLARMHLRTLDGRMTDLLESNQRKLDDYTKAHLLDLQFRIRQVLQSELDVTSVR